MFKCTVCQKLYSTQPSYCECGNDEFIYMQDNVSSDKAKTTPRQNSDVISVLIFVVCLILSGCVLFLFNPVKRTHKSAPKSEKIVVQTDIPDIDKIWNDAPAYVSTGESGSTLEVYKKSLQNMLNSNITPKQFSGAGSCDIEFTVAADGSLVNRRMFKKEGNNEFNKIILNMLKNTNEHRIPPAEYLGEVIKGEVFVQDGLIKLYIK